MRITATLTSDDMAVDAILAEMLDTEGIADLPQGMTTWLACGEGRAAKITHTTGRNGGNDADSKGRTTTSGITL